MLSEEEKQAIESLRKNRGVSFAQADIISNLIDKQQKEIKKLEEQKRGLLVETYKSNDEKDKEIEQLKERQDYARLEKEQLLEDSISKDKIREKIKYITEHYEKEIKPEEMYHWGYFTVEEHFADIIAIYNELLEE